MNLLLWKEKKKKRNENTEDLFLCWTYFTYSLFAMIHSILEKDNDAFFSEDIFLIKFLSSDILTQRTP